MATLRELIIKISANSQSFQSEIQRASRMGSEYYRTLQNGGRQAAAAAREQRRALAELNSQLTEIRASAVGMAGAFAGGGTGCRRGCPVLWQYGLRSDVCHGRTCDGCT